MVCKRSIDGMFTAPSEHVLQEVRRQLGEDEGRLQHAEHLLDQWIQSQPHLPKNYDRRMLASYLRGAKFNLETTKKKLEGYFLAKHAFPEYFQNRSSKSEQITNIFEHTHIAFLPKLTKNGERISVMSIANPDASGFDIVATVKLFFMIFDLVQITDTPVLGEIVIFDCAHFTTGHLLKFLSPAFKHLLSLTRDAYAARVLSMHVINAPTVFEKLLTAIRPFMHEKVKARFRVHKSKTALLDIVDASALPEDFGGQSAPFKEHLSQWRLTLDSNSDWFKDQDKIAIVGSPPRRIEKFRTQNDLEGSFRKLNID